MLEQCKKCLLAVINGAQKSLSEILSTPADSAVGYFVWVDLAYRAEVHDVRNDLPLAPEIKIPTEWTSDNPDSFGLNVGSSTEKTCGNFARRNALHLRLRKHKISSQAWPRR